MEDILFIFSKYFNIFRISDFLSVNSSSLLVLENVYHHYYFAGRPGQFFPCFSTAEQIMKLVSSKDVQNLLKFVKPKNNSCNMLSLTQNV